MCLRSLHVTGLTFAFFHLVQAPCFLSPTAVAKRPTSSRWWISTDTIFLLFTVDSFDHQTHGWRPTPAFPDATVPIISFVLRADSAFSTAIYAFYFRPVITEGWAFFTSGSRESRSIWKSIYTYVRKHIFVYIHTHTHTHTHIYIYIYIPKFVLRKCTFTYMYIYIHYIYTYIYVYIHYIYINIYMNISIYIRTHTHICTYSHTHTCNIMA